MYNVFESFECQREYQSFPQYCIICVSVQRSLSNPEVKSLFLSLYKKKLLCSLPKIVLESPQTITFLEDLVLKREGYNNLKVVLQLLPPHTQWQHDLTDKGFGDISDSFSGI